MIALVRGCMSGMGGVGWVDRRLKPGEVEGSSVLVEILGWEKGDPARVALQVRQGRNGTEGPRTEPIRSTSTRL